MVDQLKVKLGELQQENLVFMKMNAKLKEKLLHCAEFFKKLINEFDTNSYKKDIWISQLTKENDYLKKVMNKNYIKTNTKTVRRARTMDGIESDSENECDKNINVAVKLLAIKYNFEKLNYRKHTKNKLKHKNKVTNLYASVQNRTQSLDNLKSDKVVSKINKFTVSDYEEYEIEEVDIEIEEQVIDKENEVSKGLSKSCEMDEDIDVDVEIQKRLSSYSFM
jgi:hypothetical protein